jgi:two-component system sensor histidine kinase/response regulator
MKILIVEDDDALRQTLQDILEVHGHEVLAAADGVQGLALAAQGPEFIFCDVNMPNLDGHGLLAGIKQLPGVADVPFVFVTAQSERDDLRKGMALGADDYITKPYTQDDILAAIAARTKRQRGLRDQIQTLSERQHREIHAQWSHELLTPLNAVLGSLELIESAGDALSPAELREMLSLIREGAERQERLARKLIHYFSLEQLVNAPKRATPALCTASVAVAAGAGAAARRRKREADVAVAAGPGRVTLGEQWLATALDELVDNAAVFSPPGTPITVTGTGDGGHYRITVTDQGPGLAADQLAQVGAFTQFDRKEREQQGLGLGLAIARLATRLAGGELTLAAGTNGRGLRAELSLPAAGAPQT